MWLQAGLLNNAMLESADSISRQYAIGPLAYVACFALTWVSVWASLALNVALAVFLQSRLVLDTTNRLQQQLISKTATKVLHFLVPPA